MDLTSLTIDNSEGSMRRQARPLPWLKFQLHFQSKSNLYKHLLKGNERDLRKGATWEKKVGSPDIYLRYRWVCQLILLSDSWDVCWSLRTSLTRIGIVLLLNANINTFFFEKIWEILSSPTTGSCPREDFCDACDTNSDGFANRYVLKFCAKLKNIFESNEMIR